MWSFRALTARLLILAAALLDFILHVPFPVPVSVVALTLAGIGLLVDRDRCRYH